jgi:cysteine desulfurase
LADTLADHPAYFHVDAAQGYGKHLGSLRHSRIDMISVSGHKIHGPKGVGALILRKRDGARPPLAPLLFGGGQERGLRPGTLPVALIAGLGKAAELALAENAGLAPLQPVVHGDRARMLGNMVNLSIPGMDSESVMEAWEEFVAISNGAACTSQSYRCSHVLAAMRLSDPCQEGALRFSWCAATELPDFAGMVEALQG